MKISIIIIIDFVDCLFEVLWLWMCGWMWFVVLWVGGVIGVVMFGYVFKIFMNLMLFVVKQVKWLFG